MAQLFDALDFFQTHQLQERNSLRALENSRQNLQSVRGKLEESELQLMLKKKAASDLRKRLANLYSTSTISSQLDLLSSHFSLMSTVERKTTEKIGQLEEKYCGDDEITCASVNEFEANELHIQKVVAAKSSIASLNKELSAKSEELVSKRNQNSQLEASIVPLNERLEALKLEANAVLQERKETLSHVTVLEREIVVLEDERENVLQARVQARKTEMENQAQVKKEVLHKELQAKRARLTELQVHHSQKTKGLEAHKKVQNGLQQLLVSFDVEMADLENRSNIDCEVLSKRLEELRIQLNQLRGSPSKSEEECWNRRKAEQESQFMKECASMIEPKREAVTALKRTLREKEDSFTRMVKEYAAQYDALC